MKELLTNSGEYVTDALLFAHSFAKTAKPEILFNLIDSAYLSTRYSEITNILCDAFIDERPDLADEIKQRQEEALNKKTKK